MLWGPSLAESDCGSTGGLCQQELMAVRRRKGGRDGVVSSEAETDDCQEKRDAGGSTAGFQWTPVSILSVAVGLFMAYYSGSTHGWLMATLHENVLWFSNIKEVEREISFRTETGLYYSYYKQLVNAPTIAQGLYELVHDNITEHGKTINILERFNIYQEVVMALLYRFLSLQKTVEPVYFYIHAVFGLHSVLVMSLYGTTWLLSGSWLAGILSAAFYTFNKVDTTRVEFTIALRESWALPFWYMQMFLLTVFFHPNLHRNLKVVTVALLYVCTFCFALTWQFAQFALLLQAMALFGCAVLDVIPAQKIRQVWLIQAGSLLAVCVCQFFNKMVLCSLVLSFIPSAMLVIAFKERVLTRRGLPWQFTGLVLDVILVMVSMLLFNKYVIKTIIKTDADQHIFNFLMGKFGLSGNKRDFDAQLYLCETAFRVLPLDTFVRLSKSIVFPLYAVFHLCVLLVLMQSVLQNWRPPMYRTEDPATRSDVQNPALPSAHPLLLQRPQLAYHAISAAVFGCLAVSTMRFKYLWTPHMCVLAAAGVADFDAWKILLNKLHAGLSESKVHLCRHIVTAGILALLFAVALPSTLEELKILKEFHDPDTVQLMEWIKKETPVSAAFTGSMQLMAGVKLCTGRPITNHPHYEDRDLRNRTKQLYQIYGRRHPQEVHAILKAHGTSYIIVENSICYERGHNIGCRLRDLMDMTNHHIVEGGTTGSEDHHATHARFCHAIQSGAPEYRKYFTMVFQNKTFRTYKVS
ncbi:protein C-mannosyl-transferase DPY19L3-like [Branchiostoma lanceolatum]|uniref:protein C-mannosyl-transferase DPY19L3-like n=1 Tax=Branchiostoma lanceolatum TaxID=7740 RepID=UPI00345306DC